MSKVLNKLTVRSPLQGSSDGSNNVNLSKRTRVGEKFLQTPEANNNENSKGKAHEEPSILAVFSKDLDGANSTPENGGSEECVGAGAEESHRRVLGAHILDVHLELHDTSADDRRDESCQHLTSESDTRGNLNCLTDAELCCWGAAYLDVVGDFEVIGKRQSVSTRNITVSV